MSFLKKVCSEYVLGSCKIPMRIIRASMFEPFCPGGKISEEFIEHHEGVIESGVLMTSTGFVAVNPDGSVDDTQLDMTKNSVAELSEFPNRIHDLGGVCSLQISFCGPKEVFVDPSEFSNWFVFGYSEEELSDLKDSFIEAAIKAKDAGFDAVEVHHFLLSNFFFENGRSDGYGGTLENNAKFPSEIISGIRDAVGEGFPIFAKLRTGITTPDEDLLYFAKALEGAGASALVTFPNFFDETAGPFCYEKSLLIQDAIDIPVVFSGGVFSPADLEVAMGDFELVQMGRALLREPQFFQKMIDEEDIEECVECSGCLATIWEELDLRCIFQK